MRKFDKSSSKKENSRYTEVLNKFITFKMKYSAITLEFKKTRGVNVLDIHKLHEQLIEIKNKYEIILYGVLLLRNNVEELQLFFMKEFGNSYKEVKAEKSYILYFLKKVQNKYPNELLEESKENAKVNSEFYLKKNDVNYLDIYKFIEEMEFNIRKMILLKSID